MSTEEYAAARETETKFQFYFTALAFTILGLAIQTAPESAPEVSRVFELLSWLLLLIAGLLSLWYLEVMPSRRIKYAELAELRNELGVRDYARTGQQSDEWQMIDTSTIRRDEKHLTEILAKSDKSEYWKYRTARACLVLGLIGTGVARGYPLVQEIAGVAKSSESTLILTAPN